MKFRPIYLPVYILIASLFIGNFIFQYLSLLIFLCFYLLGRPVLKYNIFLVLPFGFLAIAILSYLYNLFTGLADGYSILFWIFSYFPPIILTWLILSHRGEIDFYNIYSFYKKIVYLQSFILIFSAFQHGTLVVGDVATGTVGDANWVAFHICVVLIYEVVRAVTLSKTKSVIFRNKLKSFAEIFYFFIVLIIPESTANLGFILIILGFLFFNEYVLAKINPQGVIIFLVCAGIGFYILKDTFVYRRIEDTVFGLTQKNIEADYNYFKLTIYKKILSGEIYEDVNPLIGSGPSTFTSRSSVVRMPEERTNDIPIQLPYFKNKIFSEYISPAYTDWRESGQSYGNFASPQTTIISIAVELGLIALLLFFFYFYCILRKLHYHYFPPEFFHLPKFGKYLTFFFLMSLFHMNFWEYPIISFTYVILVFGIIKHSSDFCNFKKNPT